MAKKSKKSVAQAMDVPMDVSPHLHLSEKDLPAIKKWNLDEDYTVTLKLKMTGIHKTEWDGGKVTADFKVKSVEHAD